MKPYFSNKAVADALLYQLNELEWGKDNPFGVYKTVDFTLNPCKSNEEAKDKAKE